MQTMYVLHLIIWLISFSATVELTYGIQEEFKADDGYVIVMIWYFYNMD